MENDIPGEAPGTNAPGADAPGKEERNWGCLLTCQA